MDGFKEFGSILIDSVGDIAGGIGNNYEATGLNNLAMAERNKLQNQLIVEKHRQEQENKKKMADIAEKAFYAVLAIVVLYTFVSMMPKIKALLK